MTTPISDKAQMNEARDVWTSGKASEDSKSEDKVGPPSITLPKGGGAIRDIGEKFSVNAATGTGSFTVPIFTSPGRSGFGPQLSLSYDSGSGNGPFGFGWSMSLKSITRKTDKGLPRYFDLPESDVFILSGAEDLVPLLNADGSRFEGLITTSEDRYTIHRYCPRIEGLFARIERWTRQSDGDVHWCSISKDNILTIYGKDSNSRITDPLDPMRIFSWLICETRDDKGNAVLYTYKQEDGSGVNLALACEHNRGGTYDPRRNANRYLKSILYGNDNSFLDPTTGKRPLFLDEEQVNNTRWMFEVIFDYGEHDIDLPKPEGDDQWTYRQDPFSSYRAGFEVRTTRLCKRVLMFHHFEGEKDVGKDCLVHSTDIIYSYEKEPADASKPVYAFISSITQTGYKRENGSEYKKRSMPPIEFEYTQPYVQETIHVVDPKSLENLPIGLDGLSYQWIDVFGEGIPGILTEQAGGWLYKGNISPVSEQPAQFAPTELIASKPNLSLRGGAQFMDLAGDGQPDLVVLDGPTPGLYENDGGQSWKPFQPFSDRINRVMSDPNVKLVDLDGDGHADVLISEENTFVWHRSLAEKGFGPAFRVSQSPDEEKGPRLILADPAQSIYLADMSGDGLTDLVRIRSGEVCYWPNLGYGRFGSKVAMDNAPQFDNSDMFDQKRIRLADIDGTGTTDFIYLHGEGVRLYFNQSGNSWSEPQTLKIFPQINEIVSIVPVDLLGNGTTCLVWSSPLPSDERRQMRFVDLMGDQKPHLLVKVINNLGAETHLQYTSSTKFYLQDKMDGRPWITKLPFPVHVVERVETRDLVARNLFVTRYGYHHGYFDGEEREFRGFGMVEQWDTESFATLGDSDTMPRADNVDAASHVPPVHTKTWFHTGVYIGRNHVSDYFAGLVDVNNKGEYYREPAWVDNENEARKYLLDDTVLPLGLTIDEEREACTALKGSMLRQEIYAIDGSDKEPHPYIVTEQNFAIRMIQPLFSNRHGIFFTHSLETINYHYEREYNPPDPQTSHALTLEVDNYGNVLKQASIGYGRRHADTDLLKEDSDKQTKLLITYTDNTVTNNIDDTYNYRTALPCESRTFELTGYKPSGDAGRFLRTDFVNQDPNNSSNLVLVFDGEVSYEDSPTGGKQRRLIEDSRTLYRKDDLTSFLALGKSDSLALVGETYKLAFLPALLTKVYQRRQNGGGQPPENLLPNPTTVLEQEGGYVSSQKVFPDTDLDDHWWIPSGQVFYHEDNVDALTELTYAKEHFFLPRRYQDPFGNSSTVTFDDYDLLMVKTRDPINNTITAKNDYRFLQPKLSTDPNGNQTEVAFDALGMVVGTAIMGKPEPAPREGDSLDGFEADLDENDVLLHVSNPLTTDPHSILKRATTRLVYDLFAYQRTKYQPNPQSVAVYTLARETHDADLRARDKSKIQHSFSYSDGFGREIQTKIQAEPEKVDGVIGQPRWVGNGWTIFNNKGKPIRKYEPFFSASHNFQFGLKIGVSPIMFYDPAERVVATLHPNHTYDKIVFNPWQQITWDVSDTIKIPENAVDPPFDPKNDPDVGKYFKRLPDDDYLPTWYDLRTDAAKALKTWPDTDERGHPLPDNAKRRDSEKDAAIKGAAHSNTPSIAYLDTLGRPFLTVIHNKVVCKDHDFDGMEELFHTRIDLDIEGNQRSVRDAIEKSGESVVDHLGRIVMLYDYDMLGNRIHQLSMEANARWMLNDVTGKPIRAWDSRDHILRTEYDPLRRPLRSFVAGADPANPSKELLSEQLVYGETLPNPEVHNLRGKVVQLFDQTGKITTDKYDFKGNLLLSQRQLAKSVESTPAYKTTVDWSASVQLETDTTYTSRTRYDALNRVIQLIAPHSDQPDAKINIIQPVYNEANLLEQVHVWLDHTIEPEGLLNQGTVPASLVGVNNIDYDAKGQRRRIDYKNGTITLYEYDEQTFRLVHLLTLRNADTFPEDCPEHPPEGWPGCQVQNLHYTYDPVGNITKIRDDAQQKIFFKNMRVEPSAEYTYDAIYRLIEATGREHLGQSDGSAPTPHSYNDAPRIGRQYPNEHDAMGPYKEVYVYDGAGNILEMQHYGANLSHPGWTRNYAYGETSLIEDGSTNGILRKTSNRLSSTTIEGNNPPLEQYEYDNHGNMTKMPQLQIMKYDFKDQLCMTRRQKIKDEDEDGVEHHGERTYYVYDASGQRTRKITELPSGKLKDERIYLGQFEIYYRHSGANAGLVRETLHIMNDQQRIALVETRNDIDDDTPNQLIRYQFTNHLGSAMLELDEQANIISYEEYSPYGSTLYQAVRSDVELNPKRYRYTGMERDEESGLNYHSARYYAPWLGRWISADPIALEGGVNFYHYSKENPITFSDIYGKEPKPPRPPVGHRYNTGRHGDHPEGSNRVGAPRLQGHHPIQDKFAKSNIEGYRTNDAPSQLLSTGTGEEHTSISNEQNQVQRANAPARWTDKSYSQARSEAVDQYRNAGLFEPGKFGEDAILASDAYFFTLNDIEARDPITGKTTVIKNANLRDNLGGAPIEDFGFTGGALSTSLGIAGVLYLNEGDAKQTIEDLGIGVLATKVSPVAAALTAKTPEEALKNVGIAYVLVEVPYLGEAVLIGLVGYKWSHPQHDPQAMARLRNLMHSENQTIAQSYFNPLDAHQCQGCHDTVAADNYVKEHPELNLEFSYGPRINPQNGFPYDWVYKAWNSRFDH
jgi:RHS repeat-associated protein